MRKLYHQVAGGWDIVLVARSAILGVQAPQVEAGLRAMLERAGLMANQDSFRHEEVRSEA